MATYLQVRGEQLGAHDIEAHPRTDLLHTLFDEALHSRIVDFETRVLYETEPRLEV